MHLQTISQVSKDFGVSLRMIRYYEKEGLLNSSRKEDYAYRVYDEAAIRRLRQIIILRKLRIPIKQIKSILLNPDAATIIEIFQKNIGELDEEITALSTIRTILHQLEVDLQEKANIAIQLDMLTDPSALPLLDTLSLSKHQIKETPSSDDLFMADKVLSKLRNVRVVYLPPMTIASVCVTGEQAQERAWQSLNDFVEEHQLRQTKPDLRVFRFDNVAVGGQHFDGHEVWVSIPDDWDIAQPFIRKRFLGGLFAVHYVGDDGFRVEMGLQDWVNESDNYQFDYAENLLRCDPPISEINAFGGMRLVLNEVLNYYNNQDFPTEERLDIFFPIKEYQEMPESSPISIPDSREKCGHQASLTTKPKFKIFGFTKVMLFSGTNDPEEWEKELWQDGRMQILLQYKKDACPMLGFRSHDMDSDLRGGWRNTICLSDDSITDLEAFMKHHPYSETIDTSQWLIIERTPDSAFNEDQICMQLGHTWNGNISGSFVVYDTEDPQPPTPPLRQVSHLYPVKV